MTNIKEIIERLQKLKRYEVTIDRSYGDSFLETDEDPTGEWVKSDDVEDIIDELIELQAK